MILALNLCAPAYKLYVCVAAVCSGIPVCSDVAHAANDVIMGVGIFQDALTALYTSILVYESNVDCYGICMSAQESDSSNNEIF